ncbi:MAG: Ig-like domain-containing protein [Patescibacteria group bacterium]
MTKKSLFRVLHLVAGASLFISASPVLAAGPSVGSVSPTSVTANTPTTMSATVSSGAGIQYCHLYVESEDVGAMTISGNKASLAHTFTRSGVHTVFVFCKDNNNGMSSGPNTSVMVQGGTTGYVPPLSNTTPPAEEQPTQPVTQEEETMPSLPVSGNLIKLECPTETEADHPCKAVYFIGKDSKRHAFPNSKIFFSWYEDFSSVSSVASGVMAEFPLGKNVGYRPGSKMVKFSTLNNVYVVSKNEGLRWVTTEAVAVGLYGDDWNTKIDDIPDTFYSDYNFGTDISDVTQFDVQNEYDETPTINDTL